VLRVSGSLSIYGANRVIFLPMCVLILAVVAVAVWKKFDAPWIKYMLVGSIVLLTAGQFFVFTTITGYLVIIPILISARYFNKRFILRIFCVTGVIFAVSCAANLLLKDRWELMQVAHESVAIDIWSTPKSAFAYLIVPLALICTFVSIYAVNMTRSGHMLQQACVTARNRAEVADAELKMAADIQRSVLPAPSFTTPNGFFQVEAREISAKEVGGDFYDYYMLDDHVLTVLIADVSDKGASAAMFMMSSKKAIRCAAECSESLEDAVKFIAKLIAEGNESTLFLTLWLAVIDTETGYGKFINAGHPFPLIRNAEGSVRPLTNEPDMFIGVFPDKVPRVHTFSMDPGDTLVLFTDGITDSMNTENEPFGDERLLAAVQNAEPGAKGTVDRIMKESTEFSLDRPQFDDMTLLALHCEKTTPLTERCYELIAGKEGTATALKEINTLLREVGCTDDARRDADVVVDELCTNIADHAYDEKGGRLSIRAQAGSSFIRIIFTDDGPAFDPTAHEKAELTDEPAIGGLGIFFCKQLTDNMYYRRVGESNELTIEMLWNV